jgi:hypothetical protein
LEETKQETSYHTVTSSSEDGSETGSEVEPETQEYKEMALTDDERTAKDPWNCF